MKTYFLLFILSFFISSLSLATKEKKNSWSGKYLHESGQFEMTIDQWDKEGIDVTIARIKDPKDPEFGGFVADIKGNIAEHRDIRDPKGCRMKVEKLKHGVRLYNYCGGSKKDSGFYKKED
jgi:hypothetical protein